MRENAIYTVTPPDMLLPESGPIVTIVSSKSEFIQQVETLYEHIFKSVSVTIYHPNGKVNEANMAWLISMIRFSDTVYVDMEDLNELAVAIVLLNCKNTVFVNQSNRKKGLTKLLNSTQNDNSFTVVDSIEEYSDVVLEGLGV